MKLVIVKRNIPQKVIGMLGCILVSLALMAAGCGSTPSANSDEPIDIVSGHTDVPRSSPRAQRPAQAAKGIPVETRAIVKFPDGSVDEYTMNQYDSSQTKLLGQFRYSASGALMEQVRYTYKDNTDLLTTKITTDSENKYKSRVVYEYDDRNLLLKETLVNAQGRQVSSFENQYDGDGNRIIRIINNAAGAKLAETRYTVQNGLVISSETKDAQGKIASTARNQYDSGGHLVNQRVMKANGSLAAVVNITWEGDLEVRNEQLDANNRVQFRVFNEYGPNGELIKRTTENFQTGNDRPPMQVQEFEYTFR